MTSRSERLLALDVFRGATVAGMLLVNDPGSWSHIFPPLAHAAWNGWTPTDLIFPFFLFIVGITTELLRAARRARGDSDAVLERQILRRGGLIILFGLLLSWFPFFTWGPVDPAAGRIVDRLYHVRIPGILQRIGVVYVAAALLTLRTSVRARVAIVAALLVGYWMVLTLGPISEPSLTVAAQVDRLLLDWGRYGNHIWSGTVTWDPEGVLSTVPAIATTILGTLVGKWLLTERILSEKLNAIFAVGCIAIVLGLVWGWVFPINKNLWTSSYVVFTAGMAAVTLATCMWLIDVRGSRWWTGPFLVFGVNPFLAFIGSEAMARLIYSVITVPGPGGGRVSVATAGYDLLAGWFPPRVASLVFALSFVVFWLGVLTVLYRRNFIFKV
jgi:predicted acyltransferase